MRWGFLHEYKKGFASLPKSMKQNPFFIHGENPDAFLTSTSLFSRSLSFLEARCIKRVKQRGIRNQSNSMSGKLAKNNTAATETMPATATNVNTLAT